MLKPTMEFRWNMLRGLVGNRSPSALRWGDYYIVLQQKWEDDSGLEGLDQWRDIPMVEVKP